MSSNRPERIFVYVDRRQDTGIPFYVGKGVERRTKSFHRNVMWHRIAAKHGVIRDIVFETNDDLIALDEEIRLIRELKTRNYDGGANLTDGGEGTQGHCVSDETKKKLANVARSRQFSEATRSKISMTSRGRKYPDRKSRPPVTDETRKKISDRVTGALKGRKLSEEQRKKISDALRGRSRPESVRLKISNSQRRRLAKEG